MCSREGHGTATGLKKVELVEEKKKESSQAENKPAQRSTEMWCMQAQGAQCTQAQGAQCHNRDHARVGQRVTWSLLLRHAVLSWSRSLRCVLLWLQPSRHVWCHGHGCCAVLCCGRGCHHTAWCRGCDHHCHIVTSSWLHTHHRHRAIVVVVGGCAVVGS